MCPTFRFCSPVKNCLASAIICPFIQKMSIVQPFAFFELFWSKSVQPTAFVCHLFKKCPSFLLHCSFVQKVSYFCFRLLFIQKVEKFRFHSTFFVQQVFKLLLSFSHCFNLSCLLAFFVQKVSYLSLSFALPFQILPFSCFCYIKNASRLQLRSVYCSTSMTFLVAQLEMAYLDTTAHFCTIAHYSWL